MIILNICAFLVGIPQMKQEIQMSKKVCFLFLHVEYLSFIKVWWLICLCSLYFYSDFFSKRNNNQHDNYFKFLSQFVYCPPLNSFETFLSIVDRQMMQLFTDEKDQRGSMLNNLSFSSKSDFHDIYCLIPFDISCLQI